MYKIIYVDEYGEDIEHFLDYFEEKDSKEIFKIVAIHPSETIEETIENIFSYSPDAIISDYMLNEYKTDIPYNVPYTGVNLVEKILEFKIDFPCFVMTSYDDQAIKTSQDVNLVYIKDILHGSEAKTNAKANFLDTVENQIIHYMKRIEAAEDELDNLIERSTKRPLNGGEEERILELEQIIENATDKRCKIPKHLKELENLKHIHKMIENTDKLLEELKKEK